MERIRTKVGVSLCVLTAAGVSIVLAAGCSSTDAPSESTATVQESVTPPGGCTTDASCQDVNEYCDAGICLPRSCSLSDPFGSMTPVLATGIGADGIAIAPGGLSAIISRKVGADYNLYSVTRGTVTDPFRFPTAVTPLNTPGDERSPWLSADGRRLYFHRPGTVGATDLYVAERPSLGEAFGAPGLAGNGNLNGNVNDEDAFLLPDEGTLFFSSSRAPGTDLYFSIKQNGVFPAPTRISSNVNSDTYADTQPALTRDGLSLYFSSQRLGVGNDTNGDIFLAQRASTGVPFSTAPENVSVLNASGIDFPVGLSPDGCSLYLASNRELGASSNQAFRIYRAQRQASLSQVTVTVNVVGSGSVGAPFSCTSSGGTCTATQTFGQSLIVDASSSAIWTGNCGPNGTGLSSDGVVPFVLNSTCTVTFPGTPSGIGGACITNSHCQSGLECHQSFCRCPPGNPSCPCTPSCGSNSCGADNGCGGTCPCGAGEPCAASSDCSGGAACCGGVCGGAGCACITTSQCAAGLSCSGGTCVSGPPAHCSNNVEDAGETGVDCGGQCPGCQPGGECTTTADCAEGLECGTNNGACFGGRRAASVCWAPACIEGDPSQCGQPDSPCGSNCSCVTSCIADDPNSGCPVGEACRPGAGNVFGAPTRDACLPDPECPSNDPLRCGTRSSLCGRQCECKPDCSAATCANPGDGCAGVCPEVCNLEDPCSDSAQCVAGTVCIPEGGPGQCLPVSCAFRELRPPLCGSPGALCGEQCPVCTPQCNGRQSGFDPACGTSCGVCGGGTFENAAGGCTSPSTDPPPMAPDGNGGQQPIANLPPAPASTVGTLKGAFSVGDDGKASYTIPIEVPPGRAGLEPELSLRYTGSRQPSEFGLGWRVDGFSSITRCRRIQGFDEYAAPIQNNPSDAFCLDGKRLTVVPGGVGGTEYRTAVDSFAKITSYVDPNGGFQYDPVPSRPRLPRSEHGPDYFEVRTKDGRILTYGRTMDSLVLSHSGLRHAWLLNRVEDRAGNTIVFAYRAAGGAISNDSGGVYPFTVVPHMVSYTGHGDTPGNRRVVFNYEVRSEPTLSSLQGGLVQWHGGRLSRIVTYVDDVPVKNYKLQYAGPAPNSDTTDQIQQVSECAGGDDTRCKPPTRFSYQFTPGFTDMGPEQSISVGGGLGQVDFNGDGILDYYLLEATELGAPAGPDLTSSVLTADLVAGGATTVLQLGLVAAGVSTGGVAAASLLAVYAYELGKWVILGAINEGGRRNYAFVNDVYVGTTSRTDARVPITFSGKPCDGTPTPLEAPLYFLDYNRDGLDDVAGLCGDGTLRFALSQGNGTFVPEPPASQVQLPIDGFGPGFQSYLWNALQPMLFDIDGDSLEDILSCKDELTMEVRRRQSLTAGFAAPITFVVPEQAFALCREYMPYRSIIDVDGDGIHDLMARDSYGSWQVLRYVPDAGGSLKWEMLPFTTSNLQPGLGLADLNGDNLVDVWSVNNARAMATIWMNTGNAAFMARNIARQLPDQPNYRHVHTVPVDFDGNGRLDLIENWRDGPRNYNVALVPNADLSLLTLEVPPGLKDLETSESEVPTIPAQIYSAGDLDADGGRDILGVAGRYYGLSRHNFMLSRVVDGLGKAIQIEYDKEGAYQQDCTGVQWPEPCLKRLTGLVTSHSEGYVTPQLGTPPLVEERRYDYTYKNARVNVTGHGWLGFEKRTIVASTMGFPATEVGTTTIEYQPVARYSPEGYLTGTPPYVYPLAGLPKTITVDRPISPNATAPNPIETGLFERRTRIQNHWRGRLSASGLLYPALDRRETTVYDRPGASPTAPEPPFEVNGAMLSEHRQVFTRDTFDNVEQLSEELVGGDGVVYETRNTVTEFSPDEGSWLIANPDSSTTVGHRGDATRVRAWSWGYDWRGLLTSETRSPSGPVSERHTSTYVLNAFGNPDQIIESVASGEPPRTTTITYDADQVFPLTVTNELGHLTQVRFDRHWGSLATLVDPNDSVVRNAYDGFGALAETQDPTGTSVYISVRLPASPIVGPFYSHTETTRERTDVNGVRTGAVAVETDHFGRPVTIRRESLGGVEVVENAAYDLQGRLIKSTAPHVAGTSGTAFVWYTYDGLDRLVRRTHADETYSEVHYASQATLVSERTGWMNQVDCGGGPAFGGCVVEIALAIDEEEKRNVTLSDPSGLVLRNFDGDNVDSLARRSTFSYAPFGQLRRALDNGGNFRFFDRDNVGRLVSYQEAGSVPSITSYNGYDERTSTRDPGMVVRTFQHDALGRLERILDGSKETRWIYDTGVNAVGRLAAMISPATAESPNGQRVDYTYEPVTARNRGLLERVDYVIDGVTYPLTLTYDDHGRTESIRYPNMGEGVPIEVKNTYDPWGALTHVDEVGSLDLPGGAARPLWQMTDHFEGYLLRTETFGNGAVTTNTYTSARHHLESIVTELGSPPQQIQNLAYTYYDNGQVYDRTSGVDVRRHTYDALGRIEAVGTPSNPSVTVYEYDHLGNLKKRGGTSLTYEPTRPNLVQTVGSNFYHHDSAGRLDQRSGPEVHGGGAQTIGYTPFDLPEFIVTGQPGASTTTRFEYTADEERLIRRDPDVTRHFVSDLYQRALDTTTLATREERFRLYAGTRSIGEIVRTNGTDRTLYFHGDNQNSVDTVSNDLGAVFQQSFDPFGSPLTGASPELTRAGYTGHQHDRDLGLIDMRGRIYDPLSAQFVSRDPVMQAPFWSQGLNGYAYVFNDPINNVDPTGFSADGGGGLIAGLLFGGLGAGVVQRGLVPIGPLQLGYVAGRWMAGGYDPGTYQTDARPPTRIAPPMQEGNAFSQCAMTGACLAQNAGSPASGAQGMGSVSDAMPYVDLSREADFLALSLIPAARAAQLIATGARLAQAARTARALSIAAKAARGARAEVYVARLFEKSGLEIAGRHVSVRTTAGLRNIDVLVRDKAGELFAIEVKSGAATRNAAQLAKDRLLASEGGRLVGANAGRLAGEHRVINTIEFLVP